jgi:glycosyltransferase involved in cell wall biosynthesis
MTRVGITGHGFVDWGGGLDFLRIIASSLRCADSSVELHVLLPIKGPLVHLRNARDWRRSLTSNVVVNGHRPAQGHIEGAFAGLGAHLHAIDLGRHAMASAAKRLNLDVLLPAITPPKGVGIPWIGYLFDFQHKHLPHFFSDIERTGRDLRFGQMLGTAKAVIVNARDVVKDIRLFFPNHPSKIFALPFSPAPAGDSFDAEPDDVRRRYNIKGPYFVVCNQFWKHKDHGTAFKAFAALAPQHPELSLVCTGATSDYRFPDYFTGLMKAAASDGTASRIYTLGLIPKLDQLALIRGAVALVQPTLFEGGPGGGAVYDAVALGAKAIVSDIAVNTEIDNPLVSFFKAGDAGALAHAMAAALQAKNVGTLHSPADLIQLGFERRRLCGQTLWEAIEFVL